MPSQTAFVIDFDSTLVQTESLEELAALALAEDPERERVLEAMRSITRAGMEGRLSMPESLQRRLELFRAHRRHVEALTDLLKAKLSPSFKRNAAFIQANVHNIFVLTHGFFDYVAPVVAELGIPADRVHANRFEYAADGTIVGFDRKAAIASEEGKVAQVRALALGANVCVLGDGYTDYEIRKAGLADTFVAYTETVNRESVVALADATVADFDEFVRSRHRTTARSRRGQPLRVLLLEAIHEDAAEAFTEDGFAVDLLPKSLSERELCKAIRSVAVLGLRSKTPLPESVLADADELLVVGAYCIGTDKLDLAACSRRGISVFNAPYSNTRSVVELALGEIIMLVRGIFDKSVQLHAGRWHKEASGACEVRGKRLGIVGYGNIGSQLSVLGEAVGMEVLYYDIAEKLALGNARACPSLVALLERADVVSVHVDGRQENRGLFGAREFSQMREGAVFLNLSRGFVVDVEALRDALSSGRLKGAAIDVHPQEPARNGEGFGSALQGCPNVILTPHIGGSTVEAQWNIATSVTSRILQYVNTGNSLGSVNFPEIQLAAVSRTHRFLHVHENVPGILARINGILAARGSNIEGQYLKTNEEVGYVITDVAARYDASVIDELQSIEGTIRFRVLY